MRLVIVLVGAVSAALGLACECRAQLAFFYDPETGNVALDTSGTRTGKLNSYAFEIWRSALETTDFRFRPEEQISLWSPPFAIEAKPRIIGETSFSRPIEGYFTIGDVFPAGLSQESWESAFAADVYGDGALPGTIGRHSYVDSVGGGQAPDAVFIFGQPNREFDNRWDLVDPDDLDWATEATLIYNPKNGAVTIDTLRGEGGGHISWFLLESDEQFRSGRFTPWLDTPFVTSTPGVIGLAADAIEPGVYPLGLILPSKLTLPELRGVLTNASFVSRLGFGGADFDLEDATRFRVVLAVPEPGTIGIAAGAVLVGTLTRRRAAA